MRRLKAKIIAILSVSGCAVILIYVLYLFTFQPNKGKNGFTRKYTTAPIIPLDTLEGRDTFDQIAGVSKTSIYIMLTNDKKYLFKTDWHLRGCEKITFGLPNDRRILSRIVYQVDSSLVNIFSGNGPDVFKTTLNDPSHLTQYHYSHPLFTRALALPNGHYLFRGFDPKETSNQQVFILWDPLQNVIRNVKNPFPQSEDLGIGNDGILDYDTSLKKLIYIQFYRNGIILIDSSLSKVENMKTIDTAVYGRTTGGGYRENGNIIYENNTPQMIVNAFACVDAGKVYISSSLRADNEEKSDYSEYSSIDVYDLKLNRYLHSFKIPNLFNKHLATFRIFNDNVVVTYPAGIVTYRLNFQSSNF